MMTGKGDDGRYMTKVEKQQTRPKGADRKVRQRTILWLRQRPPRYCHRYLGVGTS